MNRRTVLIYVFICLAGLVVLVMALSQFSGSNQHGTEGDMPLSVKMVNPENIMTRMSSGGTGVTTATPAPTTVVATKAATATPTATIVITATIPVATPVVAPATATSVAAITGTQATTDFEDEVTWPRDTFTLRGVRIPDKVDPDVVDYAKPGWGGPSGKIPWPSLSAWLAEPGKLAVGPDFPQQLIDDSNGAIWRSDGLNQYRLANEVVQIGCAEGSFVLIVAQYATVNFETGTQISFRAPDGSNTHLYVRCPVADGSRGQDDHDLGNIVVSGHRAGYGAVQHFSGRPAGGFVSSDGALQALNISLYQESCGSEGCVDTYLVGFDMNTGAYTTARWDGIEMVPIQSNWWAPTP